MRNWRIVELWTAAAILVAAFTCVSAATPASKTETFTGKVSDTMCGAKHKEGMSPADCVRACVKHGAKYALVVGNKVYSLDASSSAAKDELNKLAWEDAQVTGTANGETIEVKSVTAAR
jgi:hypothetical protein